MISVVIPLYNKEKSIASTLRTVLQQTYQDFEIVVVNDGSTDNSLAEAESVVDSRIRIVSQSNAGVSAARNKGIEESKYDLIAFLDADDEWKPEYLETQYNLYKKYPECSVFACNYEFRDHTGKVTPTIIRKLPFDGQDGILTNYFEVASCSHPPICSITIMVKKEAIKAIGGFPLGIRSGEDLLTWARLASNYSIAYSTNVLAVFVSTPSDSKQTKAQVRFDLEDKVLDGLMSLYINDKSAFLKSYILRWYKIQCIILLEIGYNKIMRSKAKEAIAFGGQNRLFYLIMILSFLPANISKIIFKIKRK